MNDIETIRERLWDDTKGSIDDCLLALERIENALKKIERNAHGGYLMGGSYVNACGCDRIAKEVLDG